MSLTLHQKLQIETALVGIDKKEKYIFESVKMAAARIVELRTKGLYLEVTYVNSQILEKWLRFIIEIYSIRRKILQLLREADIHADVKLSLDEEETLGVLIGILRRFNVDARFLRLLTDFNEFRKIAIHHLFDGTKDLKSFDDQAKIYFESKEVKETYEHVEKEIKRLKVEMEQIKKSAT